MPQQTNSTFIIAFILTYYFYFITSKNIISAVVNLVITFRKAANYLHSRGLDSVMPWQTKSTFIISYFLHNPLNLLGFTTFPKIRIFANIGILLHIFVGICCKICCKSEVRTTGLFNASKNTTIIENLPSSSLPLHHPHLRECRHLA